MSYLGQYINTVHQRLAPFKHWFLQTVGVQSQYRGRSYASILIRPMLERMDKEGLPCYLETLDEYNVPIYEHLGFSVIEKAIIPKTELTNWAMLRKPKGMD
ncbi:GNAT family N-acetyltransferase [Chloroflexota bacterium]